MEASHVTFLKGRPLNLTIFLFSAIQGCTQELRIFGVGLNSKLFLVGSANTSKGYLSEKIFDNQNKQIVIDSIFERVFFDKRDQQNKKNMMKVKV